MHFSCTCSYVGNSFWQKFGSSRLFLSSQMSHLKQVFLHFLALVSASVSHLFLHLVCFLILSCLSHLSLQSVSLDVHLSSHSHFSGQLRHGAEGGNGKGEGGGGIGGGIGGGDGGGGDGGGEGGGEGGGGSGALSGG